MGSQSSNIFFIASNHWRWATSSQDARQGQHVYETCIITTITPFSKYRPVYGKTGSRPQTHIIKRSTRARIAIIKFNKHFVEKNNFRLESHIIRKNQHQNSRSNSKVHRPQTFEITHRKKSAQRLILTLTPRIFNNTPLSIFAYNSIHVYQ